MSRPPCGRPHPLCLLGSWHKSQERMALPPICRCATRNVRRDKPRCVKQFRIVVAARATEVGAKPSVRYDLRRRDLPWGWFCAIRIRQTTLQAARHGGRACHNLSLTATLQMLGNLRLSNAIRGVDLGMCELFLEHQSTITVGHRPGRNQPRANKRRPKTLQRLAKPRHEAKAELESVA